MNESESIETLKELYLEKCSWNSDSARFELAKLLSKAPRLEICSIKFQQGEVLDRIKVERTAAKRCPTSQNVQEDSPFQANVDGVEEEVSEEAEEEKEVLAVDDDKSSNNEVNFIHGQVIIKDMRGDIAQIEDVMHKNDIRIYL